MTVHII